MFSAPLFRRTGAGVSSNSYGALWYLMEQELGFQFTAFELESLRSLDLSLLNVIILPHGGGVRRALKKEVVERLRAWVRAGGVMIGVGGGAFALTKEESGLTEISGKSPPQAESSPEKNRQKLEDLRRQRRERQVPGNIFRVDLDTEHPLAFGLPQIVYAFMSGTRSFALSGTSGDVGAFTDDPAVSGYITEENVAKLRRRVYLAEETRGRGAVILFASDPNFRLFWRGLTPIFLNSLFMRTTN